MNHANKRMQALRAARKQLRQPAIGERARPTAQRIRHAGADFTRGDSGQITMRDSPLERAFARDVITPAQYAAGQKYRHHWYCAGLCDPLGSIDLNRIFATDLGSFSGMARTENQVFHRQRYREAVGPSARSARTFWNRRYAGKSRSSRSAIRARLGQPRAGLCRRRRAHEGCT
ncbi:MAG TPA: hypothetical protein VJ376_06170 [Pseudomonadota bacterium]|nr:hypothetical protein [Pseudomonadota bacterium]